MDAGLTVKAVGGVAQTSPSTAVTAPAPVREAVATDLGPAVTVTAAAHGEKARNGKTPEQEESEARTLKAAYDAMRRTIEKHVVIDPETREIVYQMRDEDSGAVVRQIPEKALMRLRANLRQAQVAMASGAPEPGEAEGAPQRIERSA